jgi:hypothetical protein
MLSLTIFLLEQITFSRKRVIISTPHENPDYIQNPQAAKSKPDTVTTTFLGCTSIVMFLYFHALVVPCQTSLSGGSVGHKGMEAISLVSSGLKIVLMSPAFHPRNFESISTVTVESLGITLGGDCTKYDRGVGS